MGIIHENRQNILVLRVEEPRLDASAVDHVKGEFDALLAGRTGPVVLDFSDVAFIDSRGLGLLVGLRKHNPDLALYLCAPTPNIVKILEISRLNKFIRIFPDVESALAELA